MSAIPDPIVLPADRALGLKYAKGIWEDVAVPAVKKLKETYGDGISTLGLIYNATGFPITKVLNHNWEGSLFGSHPPQTIQNGEWGVFLHVHGSDSGKDSGSVGAVVYHGQNGSGVDYDWLLAWNNPNVVPDKLNTVSRSTFNLSSTILFVPYIHIHIYIYNKYS